MLTNRPPFFGKPSISRWSKSINVSTCSMAENRSCVMQNFGIRKGYWLKQVKKAIWNGTRLGTSNFVVVVFFVAADGSQSCSEREPPAGVEMRTDTRSPRLVVRSPSGTHYGSLTITVSRPIAQNNDVKKQGRQAKKYPEREREKTMVSV